MRRRPIAERYDALVLSQPGLRQYLLCDERSGTKAVDRLAANPGTYTGTISVPNVGPFVDGSAGSAYANGGKIVVPTAPALHPGDTFSMHCWVKRTATGVGLGGANQSFNGPGANDVVLKFSGTDNLVIRKATVNDVFVTTATYPDLTLWHHVGFVKNAGTSAAIYWDGVSQAGTFTNQTIVAGTGPPDWLCYGGDGSDVNYCYVARIAYHGVALPAGFFRDAYLLGVGAA